MGHLSIPIYHPFAFPSRKSWVVGGEFEPLPMRLCRRQLGRFLFRRLLPRLRRYGGIVQEWPWPVLPVCERIPEGFLTVRHHRDFSCNVQMLSIDHGTWKTVLPCIKKDEAHGNAIRIGDGCGIVREFLHVFFTQRSPVNGAIALPCSYQFYDIHVSRYLKSSMGLFVCTDDVGQAHISLPLLSPLCYHRHHLLRQSGAMAEKAGWNVTALHDSIIAERMNVVIFLRLRLFFILYFLSLYHIYLLGFIMKLSCSDTILYLAVT